LVLGLDLRIIDVDGVAPAGMGTARPIYLVRTRHPVPHLLATAAVPDGGLVEPTSSGGQAADALASLLEEVPRVRAQVDQALARATQDQRRRLAVALATYNDFAGLARAELGLSGAGGPADPGDAAGLRALALAAGFAAARARLRGYVAAVLGPQAAAKAAASTPSTSATTATTTAAATPGAGAAGAGGRAGLHQRLPGGVPAVGGLAGGAVGELPRAARGGVCAAVDGEAAGAGRRVPGQGPGAGHRGDRPGELARVTVKSLRQGRGGRFGGLRGCPTRGSPTTR
jgi:hypothetical protein